MRAALHAHILLFFKPREKPVAYQPNPPIARVVPGHEPKQRPCDCEVRPQTERQEDNVYQAHHVGHIRAEMVRPDVSGKDWGGFDHEHLRIAALARAIQSRLPYLHHCNAVYCLKDRPSCRFHREESCHLPIPCPRFFCSSVQSANHLTQIVNVSSSEQHHRFFFPWPLQPHTCFDENTQRVALQRRLPEDDQFVVPHNLYLTCFTPSSVNVMPFDPLHGADHARGYATKYCRRRSLFAWLCFGISRSHDFGFDTRGPNKKPFLVSPRSGISWKLLRMV